MAKVTIRLTAGAAQQARKPEDLKKAAEAAFREAGGGEIYFSPFKSNGQQFALSSRTIIEVDWLPNRVPVRTIRQPGDGPVPRKRR